MNVTVVGAGYVGLVTGACLAEMGNVVTCVDSDSTKINLLTSGSVPIYEPGLEEIVKRNFGERRLRFASALDETAMMAKVYFIAVGTPAAHDGAADLSQVLLAAQCIGRALQSYSVIVNKSTAPVGTVEKIQAAIQLELSTRGLQVEFDVASNPEFLKEGDAVNDFMRPDRIIVGCDSDRANRVLRQLYSPFTRSRDRFVQMGVRDAEMTKYAANAFLATKISFMNEVAGICEELGVDVEHVRRGIGSDTRIGHAFIYPGCGYGGSCFPKDVLALIQTAQAHDAGSRVISAVHDVNEWQKERLFQKLCRRFGSQVSEVVVAVWGLSFKPGTDDMREAPSITLLRQGIAAGMHFRAYDPKAMEMARRVLPGEWFAQDRVRLVDSQYDAAQGADALVLVTEWKPFRNPDWSRLKSMLRRPIVFDGRNQYDPRELREMGFEYYGIGR